MSNGLGGTAGAETVGAGEDGCADGTPGAGVFACKQSVRRMAECMELLVSLGCLNNEDALYQYGDESQCKHGAVVAFGSPKGGESEVE